MQVGPMPSLLMGYVCLLGAAQFLKTLNQIGCCQFHFLFCVGFHKILAFSHSRPQKPSFSKTWTY